MRALILIRHAKSSWSDPGLEDFDRPLNERGRRDAPRMAQRVLARCPGPYQLLSSPALRALTTARIFADVLGRPRDEIDTDFGLYHAPPERLLARLRRVPESPASLLLFGHNPGLSELATALCERLPIADLPTAAVVILDAPAGGWAQLQANGQQGLRDCLWPKDGRE